LVFSGDERLLFLFGTGDRDGRHTTFASPTSVSHLMNYAEGSGWGSRLACELEKSLNGTQTRNRPLLIRLGIGTWKGILQQPLSTRLASTVHGRKRPARKTSLRHGNHTSDDEPFPLSEQYQYDTRLQHFDSRGGGAAISQPALLSEASPSREGLSSPRHRLLHQRARSHSPPTLASNTLQLNNPHRQPTNHGGLSNSWDSDGWMNRKGGVNSKPTPGQEGLE